MHRLDGTEEGYHLRIDPTLKCLDLKESIAKLINNMTSNEFDITTNELNLLAHADAAIDELLNVYHKVILDIDLLNMEVSDDT